MRVLTLKTRTVANINIPGYPKYYSIHGENGYTKRELREDIILSEISIESALASLAQLLVKCSYSID